MSSSHPYFANIDKSGYCDNVYCIDRANGGCVTTSDGICCRCECSKSGYPYLDQINKKCVATAPATTRPTMVITTEKTTRQMTTKMLTMQTTTEKTKPTTVVILPPPPLTQLTTKTPVTTMNMGSTKQHISSAVTTAKTSTGCKDHSRHCNAWASTAYGYCDAGSQYFGYMITNCRKSCGLCPTQRPVTVRTTVTSDINCQDHSSSCKFWKGKGHCTDSNFQHQMKTSCAKTCSFCIAPPPTISARTSTVTQKPSVVTQKPSVVTQKPSVATQKHSSGSPATPSSTKMSSNTTAVPPRLPGKKSSSVGAIAGASAGIIILLICIVIAYICIKRRRNRSRSKDTSKSSGNGMKENGNKIDYPSAETPFSKYQKEPPEAFEMREAENPYYKSADGPRDVENHYYSPGEVLQGVHSPNQHDIYYSSADVVKPTAEKEANQERGDKTGLSLPGLTQEYAYARSDSPQTPSKPKISPRPKQSPGNPKPVQENHYAALGKSSNEPGLYQTLQKPPGLESPDSYVLEAENPYYKPARVDEPSLLKQAPVSVDPGKGLSLKNNPGSRENVSLAYLEVLPNESHYQGLTLPSQNPIYQPLTQDEEYLDMSARDGEDPGNDYTYVDPAEHRV